MISIPTFTRIPASTAIGITEAKPPAPRVTTSNTSECTTPESGACGSGLNVGHGAHRGASTRQTAQQRRTHVSEALANQLTVEPALR